MSSFIEIAYTPNKRLSSSELRYRIDKPKEVSRLKIMVPLALIEKCAQLMAQPIKGFRLRADTKARRGQLHSLIQEDGGGTYKPFTLPSKGQTWRISYAHRGAMAELFPEVSGIKVLRNVQVTKMGIEFDLPLAGKGNK